MVTHMYIPKNKLTLGVTELEDTLESAKVTRLENSLDIATIVLPDTSYYPATVTESTTVELEVKEAGGAYTTIFKGIVRFPIVDISGKKTLTLSCLGSGYGLNETVVAQEYGTQSSNPTINTIAEIVTNINSLYLNKILNTADNTNFAYTNECTLAHSIPYINFPYKPVDKCLNDLIDLVAAQEASDPGAHWIVTTDDVVRMKIIGSDHADWHKYYGGADNAGGQATLTYGVDYRLINLEKMAPEANYIIYYGTWRRPSNGDRWTEPIDNAEAASMWDTNATSVLTKDAVVHTIDTCSLRATSAGAGNVISVFYPHDKDAAWNFLLFDNFNIPYLNFYIYRHNTDPIAVYLKENDTHYFYYVITASAPVQDTWYHITLPVGPNYKKADKAITWLEALDPVWSNINSVEIATTTSADNDYFCVDGLHFGGCPICRVAWNHDLPGGVAKMRLITDDVGKDDSLKATDDSGLMAQMAYNELMRLQKTVISGTVETPMIPDALPGQFFNIQAVDYRATKIVHTIDSTGYFSIITVTDDLTNSRPRARYEDQNKVWASIRPEWQDRQAANIKAGSVDIRITRLAKDYA
jgi:hypothetical protein